MGFKAAQVFARFTMVGLLDAIGALVSDAGAFQARIDLLAGRGGARFCAVVDLAGSISPMAVCA